MAANIFWLDASNTDKRILALASLFDAEFSIDWIQELSKARATTILMALEGACRAQLLKKQDLGVFTFVDQKAREKAKAGLTRGEKETLHKKIAALMINEAADGELAITSAAAQLMHVLNDLEGCRILFDAGERFRKKGASEKARACYEKIMHDLKKKRGRSEDNLFVETVIGYSKDRLSMGSPDITLSFLQRALKRSERLRDESLQAIILLRMASVAYVKMEYVSAQKYFFRGRKIAGRVDDSMVARTLDACSVVHYCYSGRFKDAVKIHESIEAELSKKTSDYHPSFRIRLVLGLSYAHIGQISQGLGMVNQLRDDALASKDHDAAARASIYIAWILYLKNDLDNAHNQIAKTLKSAKNLDLFTKSLASLLQAYVYFEKKDYKNSHAHLKRALETRNEYSFTFRGYLFDFCLAMERGIYPFIQDLSLKDEIKMSNYIGNIYSQGVASRFQAFWQQDNREPRKKVYASLQRSLALLEKSGAQLETARTKEALSRYFLEEGDMLKSKKYAGDAARTLREYGGRHLARDLVHLLEGKHAIEGDHVEEILNIGSEILEIQDIRKVAQRILSTIIRITEAERGAIFLRTPTSTSGEKHEVKVLVTKNLRMEDIHKPDFMISIRMIEESANTGHVKFDSGDSAENERLKSASIKSRICVPLLRRGKAIGILYHDNRLFRNPFKKQDLKILTYFASLAAIALDNAQAYEKIQSLNQRLSEEKNYLEEQQLEHLHFEDFVAASPAIKKVLKLVEKVATTEATVLITGDTGVGKEMVARAIHQQSGRRDKPFIRVNCGALPESLIASELFGHEKGSFTGATKRRIGRFELADTGTLFLDEIGDISMDIQIRLLRVLQTKKFERVGANESIQSDFRLLTATNSNLETDAAEGRFRQDLFYRLNVFPIYVPPLKERMADISPLACWFLKKHSAKMKKSFKGIPHSEMDKLMKYHWPGNVRELENVIERGVILNNAGLFQIPDLNTPTGNSFLSEQITLEEMERQYIYNTLQKVNWKVYGPGGAAELLGLNHSTLYSRMKKLGIKKTGK